jgi:3-isopropylmalate/(R)-2-methylmalate dehydratase small subunit
MPDSASAPQRGRAWVFGDDVLTDGQIMDMEMTRQVVYDPERLAPLAMRALSADFADHAQPGDFIVAGRNFGRGPMHIQGAIALAARGVAVLSESMARSFFRLGVSVGLRSLPFAQGICAFAGHGDELEADFASGIVFNRSRGTRACFSPLAPAVLEIVAAGGEQTWLRARAPFKENP